MWYIYFYTRTRITYPNEYHRHSVNLKFIAAFAVSQFFFGVFLSSSIYAFFQFIA